MKKEANFENVYVPSEDIVARDVGGELIVVPLTAGVGDLEEALYTLNDTGLVVWKLLDGKRTLQDVVDAIQADYTVPSGDTGDIKHDVLGFVQALLDQGIVVAREAD